MNQSEILQSIGLTRTEADIYLASLELGPSSAIQLGQKLGLTRQFMYDLLPKLLEEGYVKQITLGRRRFFQAVNPEILKDKVKQLDQQIEQLIPELRQMKSYAPAVPTITVYDNPLGMREWYRKFRRDVKRGEEKLIYSTEAGWLDLDPEYYHAFAQFEKKKNIKNRIIAPNTKEAREVSTKLNLGENIYKFAPESWSGENSKWIWRNQVVFLTIKGKATNMIVIESEQLASVERFAFERVWSSLK